MRTTVTLDDDLAKALRRRAADSGRTFRSVLEEAVSRGLQAPPAKRRYRLRSVSLGGPLPGIELRKALALADAIEDEEIGRKLALRK